MVPLELGTALPLLGGVVTITELGSRVVPAEALSLARTSTTTGIPSSVVSVSLLAVGVEGAANSLT